MRMWPHVVAWSLAAALMAVAGSVQAQPSATERAWIFLDERPAPPARRSAETGTPAAQHRRATRGQPSADALTRPVAPRYVAALRAIGVIPVVRSRWLHAVSAPLTSRQRAAVSALPFVRRIQPVHAHSVPARSLAPPSPAADSADYGRSHDQLAFMNAIAPIERGLTGAGVRIGFLDTGFRDLQHPAFLHLRRDNRLLGLRDFTEGPQTNNHGAGVVSATAGYAPGTLIGPAHEAEVLAASTEYTPSERNVEEDYFVAGLEWLERQGVDLVNVSLGYTTFDEGQRSYTTDDLDGDTGVTTRAVDAAARLGVVVVVSAGNSGCDAPSNCWFRVSTPADADSAITVGAVARDSTLLPFSSRGPTADGRIKPDVVALGRGVTAAWGPEGVAPVSGTSFAAPLVTGVVAQMLQMNPALGPIDVRTILRQTASQAGAPDTTRGWGVVNADAAVRAAERRARQTPPRSTLLRPPAPNPAQSQTTLTLRAPASAERATLALFDLLGRRVLTRTVPLRPGPNSVTLSVRSLPPGMYLYRVRTADRLATGKLAVVR